MIDLSKTGGVLLTSLERRGQHTRDLQNTVIALCFSEQLAGKAIENLSYILARLIEHGIEDGSPEQIEIAKKIEKIQRKSPTDSPTTTTSSRTGTGTLSAKKRKATAQACIDLTSSDTEETSGRTSTSEPLAKKRKATAQACIDLTGSDTEETSGRTSTSEPPAKKRETTVQVRIDPTESSTTTTTTCCSTSSTCANGERTTMSQLTKPEETAKTGSTSAGAMARFEEMLTIVSAQRQRLTQDLDRIETGRDHSPSAEAEIQALARGMKDPAVTRNIETLARTAFEASKEAQRAVSGGSLSTTADVQKPSSQYRDIMARFQAEMALWNDLLKEMAVWC